MKLLVTGFPPFPGRPVNPSQALVEAIRSGEHLLPGLDLRAELLPVEYASIERVFLQLLLDFQPDIWLAFGTSRQKTPLQLEATGYNLDDSEVPDNAGEIRRQKAIDPDGPEVVRAPWDLQLLSKLLNQQGMPTEVSNDAGRYLCNHLVYVAHKHLAASGSQCRFQFTHLAPAEFGLPLEKLLVTLQIMATWFQNLHSNAGRDSSLLA